MRSIPTRLTLPIALLFGTIATAQPGTLDATFAGDGIQILDPSTSFDNGNDVLTLPDNTSVICGVMMLDNSFSAYFAHLREDGTVDTGWGVENGFTHFDSGEETYVYEMAMGADGSIYGCGTAYPTYPQQQVALFHLLSDGTPDPAFGTAGMILLPVGTHDAEFQGLALQPDGKIVAAGRIVSDLGDGNSLLMRFNADGTPDTDFNGTGSIIASAYESEDQLWDVDVLEGGAIMAVGQADIIGDTRTILMKCDANGALDTDFGGDGILSPSIGATAHQGFSILANGNSFYVTGVYMDLQDDFDTFLAKFNADGTLADGFGTNGVTVVNTNPNESGNDIALQGDGKILVCGTSGQFGFLSDRDVLLIRFGTDGIPDTGFGTNGVVITPIGPVFDVGNGVAVQPDGKILVCGVTSGAPVNDIVVVRYMGDVGTAVEENVWSGIALFPNPSDGRSVFVDLGTDATATFTVFDAAGRTVMPRMSIVGGSRVTLPLGDQAAGVYHVRVEQGVHVRELPLVITR